MTQGPQGNNERPEETSGRFVALLRITSPDGSHRDVEVEADISAAKVSIDPPAPSPEV